MATRLTSTTPVSSILVEDSKPDHGTDELPDTSEESKQHSREVLENGVEGADMETESHDKNPNNVAGGLKATLNNPNVSEEAKESARERLGEN